MAKLRTIRDAVHGFVELDETEWKVVQSAAFQRLRDVHQLGMGHMVYPGANHTRFEHSIGCVHVASRLIDRLVKDTEVRERWYGLLGRNPEQRHDALRRIIRLAALLHDVGHAPFSHAGEGLFVPPDIALEGIEDSERGKLLKKYSHEYMSARLIRDNSIASHVTDGGIDIEHVIWVATEPRMAEGGDLFAHPELDVLNQILAGELGADRCDYLLRDAYHSGQPAGVFDLERLIQQTALIEHEGVDYLGLKEGGAIVAEQMVANRYAAYISLYFHKAKRAYEYHLVRFLQEWLPQGRLPQSIEEYISMSDSTVTAAIQAAASDSTDALHQFALPLARRAHYRVAFERVPVDIRTRAETDHVNPVNPETLRLFMDNVREKYGNEAFVDICSHSATKLRQRQHRVMVKMDGRVRSLDALSEIVRGMEERIWRLRVHASANAKQEVNQYCGNLWNAIVRDGGGS